MKKRIFHLCVLFVIVLILFRAESVITHTKESVIMCFDIIIPSLFPFFVCSGLLIYSGFAESVAKYARHIMRPVFNVAPTGAAAFVLGIISGFPSGAICARDLYKCGNLSKAEAERLLSFCNNSGPLFIIGSIGTAIYSKPIYGVVLYLIHIISSVIVGIIFRGYGKNRHSSPPTRINTNELSIPQTVTVSLDTASKNILTVCFSIIFFSAIARTLFELLPLTPTLDAIVSGLCEFSTGVLKVSGLDSNIAQKLVLTSLIVGFSGLSVHLQVMSVTADAGLSLTPYILGKSLHGIISAILTAGAIFISRLQIAPLKNAPVLSASCFTSALFVTISVTVIVLLVICFKRKRNHVQMIDIAHNL